MKILLEVDVSAADGSSLFTMLREVEMAALPPVGTEIMFERGDKTFTVESLGYYFEAGIFVAEYADSINDVDDEVAVEEWWKGMGFARETAHDVDGNGDCLDSCRQCAAA